MSKVAGLQQALRELRQQRAQPQRTVGDADQALAALAGGEVGGVTLDASVTPLLLRSAQDQLRRNHQLLRAVFECALEPMVLTDSHGRYIDANRAACDLYQLPRGQLLGRAFVDFTGMEVLDEVARCAFRNDGAIRGQVAITRMDGSKRTVEYSSVSNVTPGVDLSVMRDITDRKIADAALRESEDRYRRIVENTSEGIWIYDGEGITTFMNARMAQMLGYTVEEAIGQSIFAFMDETARPAAAARLARQRDGVSERSDLRLRGKDGTDLRVSIHADPLFDTEGRFDAALALVTDVSSERRADEARAHLAAIVEFADEAIVGANLKGSSRAGIGPPRLFISGPHRKPPGVPPAC